MKKILLAIFMLLSALTTDSWAQDRTVSGKTVDENGEAVPGVNVVLQGTSVGVTSDIDGNWKLSVPADGGTLIFSYVGMLSQEIKIGTRSVIDVTMMTDAQQLSEVVVTAYGETSKKQLTGSVGLVEAGTIENQQLVSIGNALQGTTPGVNIISTGGQPGANPTIRIRGINSINASASPLIVVDGAVYTGNLNSINPDDVESMSVLKDAGSAALYGSRGSNGVIIITTKTGSAGEAKVDFTSSVGFSSRATKPYELLGNEDMMKLTWESMVHDAERSGVSDPQQFATDNLISELGYNPYGPSFPNPIGTDGNLVSGARSLWETDWYDEMTRDQAMRREYGLAVSGGTENMKYRFSANYLSQEGEFITSKFERITTRLNLEAQANKWLSMGLKAGMIYSNQNFPPQSGSFIKYPIRFSMDVSSIYPLHQRDENGELVLDANGDPIYDYGLGTGTVNGQRPIHANYNPAGTLQFDDYSRKRYHTTFNGYLRADFLNDFYVKTNFALDMYLFDLSNYSNFLMGDERNQGSINKDRDLTLNTTWWNQLGYEKSFGEHTIDAQLIAEMQNFTYQTNSGEKAGFPFAGLKEFAAAATTRDLDGALFQERYVSFLGMANYSFKNKYFLTLSARRDGSSRFAPENRNATFYSVGGGWSLIDESFMAGAGFLDVLKLRASYGTLGNASMQNSAGTAQDYFPYLQVFDGGQDDAGRAGVYNSKLRDTGITWEKSQMINVGLDFAMMQSRLSGSIEAYKKTTNDLVMEQPFSPSLGFGGSVLTNIGEVVNSGVEVMLNSTNVRTQDIVWTTSFNISFEKNEITSLPQEEIIRASKRLKVGSDIYQFYIREWAGVDPSDGAPMWYADVLDSEGNATGERTVTKDAGQATFYDAGSALPTARGGASTSLSYKGLTLSALFNFSIGGKVINYDYSGLMHGTNGSAGEQMHVDQLNRWQQPGDITSVPRLDAGGQGNSTSTRFLYDNSYLRMRNITLSYSLSQDVLDKLKVFRTASINVQGDNLFTWANAIDGMDPEQSISGTTNYRSAVFKTYSVGIKLGF